MLAISKHLRITGVVQGVWFRESMRQQAEQLGVCGWVRNCGDGSVEALVCGAPEAVNAIVEWSKRGPPHAQVSHVEISEADGATAQRFATFVKLPTAY